MDEGYRESSESWGSLLRDAERRGMRAPMRAVGDGALGFWKALRQVFPATRERWRAVNAPHLVALLRAGARSERGLLVERDEPHVA